jgi:hypothetical protein
MKRLAMVMIAAMLAVSTVSYAQQPVSSDQPVLKDGDKCTSDAGCKCGSPAIDVKKNCTCKIDSLGGTGTQHCPLGEGGGPRPLTSVLWALLGAVIGSALTFLAMRRRGPPG